MSPRSSGKGLLRARWALCSVHAGAKETVISTPPEPAHQPSWKPIYTSYPEHRIWPIGTYWMVLLIVSFFCAQNERTLVVVGRCHHLWCRWPVKNFWLIKIVLETVVVSLDSHELKLNSETDQQSGNRRKFHSFFFCYCSIELGRMAERCEIVCCRFQPYNRSSRRKKLIVRFVTANCVISMRTWKFPGAGYYDGREKDYSVQF